MISGARRSSRKTSGPLPGRPPYGKKRTNIKRRCAGDRLLETAALGFAAGTALAICFRASDPLFWAAASLLAVPVTLALARGRVAAAFFVLLGVFRFSVAASLPFYDGISPREGDATARGRVVSVSGGARDRTTLLLNPARLQAGGGTWETEKALKVLVYGEPVDYRVGDTVEVRGRLARPAGKRNAAWPGILRNKTSRSAAAVLHVTAPAWTRTVDEAGATFTGPEGVRAGVILFWDGFNDPAAGLLKALTTGDRTGMEDEEKERFYRSGLGHLIAVSGLHIGSLAAMVYFLLCRLLARIETIAARRPVQPLAALVAVPVVAVFALLTGGQVSAVRAALMASVFFAGIPLRRRTRPTALIAAAALAMLVADPRVIAEPSFQLSFSAVTALALAGRASRRRTGTKEGTLFQKGAGYAAGLLAVSTLIALFTAPLTVFHFGRLSLAGPLANLAAVPLTVFAVLPLAWIAVVVHLLCPPLAPFFALPALVAARLLEGAARIFSALPFCAVTLPRPSPVLVAVALAGGTVILLRKKSRGALITLAVLSVLTAISVAAGFSRGSLRTGIGAAFLDVGQGEASLLRLPGGRTMLVDTGPAWSHGDAGRYVVTPALRRMGVSRIDILVLSHGHPDHSGGLDSILAEFPVGEVWLPASADPGAALHSAIPPERVRSLPVRRWSRGDSVTVGRDVTVRFHNPPSTPYGGGRGALNDNSLVFSVTGPTLEILMTGDAGSRAIADFAPLLERSRRVRIVKVPHHGAIEERTSQLVRTYQPRYAVISTGRNRYGHPDPATEQTYGRTAEVLRTDVEGAVFFDVCAGRVIRRTWLKDSMGAGGVMRSIRWAFGAL